MSGLIDRLQDRTATPNERARVLEMADEDADVVLDALSSDTGRRTFRSLFDEPAAPSELATRLDTSVQNVHYHLTNLREAGLVESIDTVYSEKGNEMTIYGPASDPLVFVGDDDRVPRVQQSLAGLAGGLAVLGAASLLVQWGAERLLRETTGATDVAPASRIPAEAEPVGALVHLVFGVLEPGVVFLAGCLVVGGLLVGLTRR